MILNCSVAVGGGVQPVGFVFDEFDEEGDDRVGDEDVERGADRVDTTAGSFSSVPENDQVVEDMVENGVGDNYRHNGSIFPSDEYERCVSAVGRFDRWSVQ